MSLHVNSLPANTRNPTLRNPGQIKASTKPGHPEEALRALPWVIGSLESAENAVGSRDLGSPSGSRNHDTSNEPLHGSPVRRNRRSQELFRAWARPEGPTITPKEPPKSLPGAMTGRWTITYACLEPSLVVSEPVAALGSTRVTGVVYRIK